MTPAAMRMSTALLLGELEQGGYERIVEDVEEELLLLVLGGRMVGVDHLAGLAAALGRRDEAWCLQAILRILQSPAADVRIAALEAMQSWLERGDGLAAHVLGMVVLLDPAAEVRAVAQALLHIPSSGAA